VFGKLKRILRKLAADIRHKRLSARYNKLIDRHKNELSVIGGNGASLLHSTGPIVVFCCRDEALRLPYFLQYYRDLGFEGFIAIDNMSSDGTRELLLEQDDVVLIEANGSYLAARCGLYWVNHVLRDKVANRRWVLLVDVDELLVFRGVENGGISELIADAESAGDGIVFTPMIDMYSHLDLDQVDYKRGEPFTGTCSYFDGLDTYNLIIKRFGYGVEGGVRDRIFFKSEDGKNKINLTKYSFFKWDNRMLVKTAHSVSPKYMQETKTIGALLHFKFFQDFREKVEVAVRDNLHWNDSQEYKVYWEGLESGRSLSLYSEASEKYVDSRTLSRLFELRSE